MGIPDNELEQITNQYLDETEENLEIELAEFQSEGWTINNKEMAMKIDYVMHKLEEKIAEDEAIAKTQKDVLQVKIDKLLEGQTKLDEWLDRSTKAYRKNIDDLTVHLHLFHQRTMEAEEAENEKRKDENKKPLKVSKSIKLTYRDLVSKVQFPEIVKEDDKLAEWVLKNHSDNIPLSELNELIESKEKEDIGAVTVSELEEILKKYTTSYIEKNWKLKWKELKGTLEEKIVDIVEQLEGEVEPAITGRKLVYFDELGQEVPHVKLIPQGVKFSIKKLDSGE